VSYIITRPLALLVAKQLLQTGTLKGALWTAYVRLINVNEVTAAKGRYFNTAIETEKTTLHGSFQDQVGAAIGA